MDAQIKKKPFGFRDKLGYLLGDFGNDFTFILSSSFLLKFYTDVMHISAGVVGLVMMLARFVDAFTDVTMGRICDRAPRTKAGKFKPWILRMCVPVALSSFLIYQSAFADRPMWFRISWLVVTYILWGSIFYTSINIPYGSMASAISSEPEDRQSLSTFRTMGSSLAGVIIGAGVPLLAYDQRVVGDKVIAEMNGGRFTLIAGVFSALAIVAYILCYYLTTERVTSYPERREQASGGIGSLISKSVKNRSLLSIIAASILMLLSQFTLQQMSNYVYPDYYANTSAQSASTLAMMLGMIIAAGAARPLTRRFGKAELSAASSAVAAAVSLILFFIRPENVWVYVAFNFFSWLGLGIFSMVSWALITDVIDDAELRHGVREDGTIYALYSFARKLGQAAAAGLTGLLLTAIGYEKIEGVAISDSVRNGIFNISSIVPAIGFILLSLVLWLWYPLNKSRVEANVRALREKHEEN
ncbi:MAG: MFS transporter [Clostridia bacterium]|nr:MFS transporter [Clostridia bacterium]